ncbi:tyrosine--tRNA ligase, cytoplasmic [Vigna unguiculata]|uniref:tyrosine--tRNA ligase, cytoplasmic n=1 Tax=Vigna unguiculata TaxID=3917 RepID=UPI0010171DC4|nr:tyrosine--tRNA ligase, cytoplasmic [Vigna unguiculata]
MANAFRVGCVISLCSLRNTTPHLPLLSNATRFRSKFPFFTLSSSQTSFGFSPSFRTLSSSSIDEAVTAEAITGNASGEAESSIRDAAGLLDIRVGRILRAWKHDEADSLYVEEVDIGEPEPRIICSGLVKYIPIEHLQGKKVIVLSNLKPRNMRGVKSCGMLMAASDAKHENVELLFPPEEATPGERIWFGTEDEKDNQPAAATPNQIQKKKIWELVQPHLKTDVSCIAMLGEHVMRTSVGSVACQSLQNANIS